MAKYKRIIGSRNPEDIYFLGTLCRYLSVDKNCEKKKECLWTGCSAEYYKIVIQQFPFWFRYYLLEGLKKHTRNTAGRYPGSGTRFEARTSEMWSSAYTLPPCSVRNKTQGWQKYAGEQQQLEGHTARRHCRPAVCRANTKWEHSLVLRVAAVRGELSWTWHNTLHSDTRHVAALCFV
jgi:hypothetical protein